MLFFSSGGVTDGISFPGAHWGEVVRVPGDEVLVNFLPFFSTALFGAKSSSVGGSFKGVPSSPGEKDKKEQ